MAPAENTNDWNPDVARVANELSSRLRTRGIAVHDADSPDDIEALLEGVEDFERAVEERGGDLMVDEPPPNGAAQPDDPQFLLPKRRGDESVSSYLKRLRATTAALRGGT
jgi:hypothetical protein